MSDLLSSLNEHQREAVLDFEAPLLVLAGAGSGKTRVITTKIAYAIEQLGYYPYQILAVTFTNRAANEMRTRVQSLLPDSDLSGLEIRTFHSFGAYLLRRYGSLIGLNDNFNIYDDEDSLSLLSSCFPDENKKDLKVCLKEIGRLKDLNTITQADLKKEEFKISSFATFFNAYQEALARTGCVDFADLIIKTDELLQTNPEIKTKLNRRYRLILVDEYQDSNSAQFKLLYDLLGPNTQLCVVGDDDQSIYRFRGAEIKNILDFPQRFKGTHTVKLEQNYRSTGAILKIATSVIQNNKGRHKKTLWTDNEDGAKPIVINANNSQEEAAKICSIILRDGNYNNTAILYRMNMLSQSFEQAFLRNRIPYKIIGALRFYDREEIKDMLSWFSLLLNPNNQVAFLRLINKPSRGLGKKTVEKLTTNAVNLIEVVRTAVATNACSGKALMGLTAFMSCYDTCYNAIDSKVPFQEILPMLLDLSGLKEYYQEEKDENISKARFENLSELGNVLKEVEPGFEGLSKFLENLMLDTSVLGSRNPADQTGVTLMTMHNTKGLEFEKVFVVGLEEGIIPGEKSVENADIEEERRIFYVAVTRARKTLYLSWSRNRSKWGGMVERQLPSRFLKEIPTECLANAINEEASSFSSVFGYKPRTGGTNNNFFIPSYTQKEVPTYKIGDSVSSRDYGVGKVIDKMMKNGRNMLKVQFEERTVVFDALYSKLDIVKPVSTTSSYKVGDRVRSADYGIGVVVKKEMMRGKEVIDVKFESNTARYNTAFAKLEKL